MPIEPGDPVHVPREQGRAPEDATSVPGQAPAAPAARAPLADAPHVDVDAEADVHGAGFQLGRRELLLAVSTAGWMLVLLALANGLRLTFLVPRTHERNVLSLLSYRGLDSTPDVLFLGSSRFHHGLHFGVAERTAERQVGGELDFYGLALYGLRPWLTYDVLRELVAERPPRRLLVLGIGLGSFEDGAFEGVHGLELFGAARDLFEVDYGRLGPTQWRQLARLPVRGAQVAWNLDWWLDPAVRAAVAHQRAHRGELGQHESTIVRRDQEIRRRNALARRGERAVAARGKAPPPRYFDGLDMHGFLKTLALLQDLPCRVVFVRMPVRPDFDAKHPPERWARFHEEVVERVLAHGFEYHDLNQSPFPRDKEYFRDAVHMTEEGRRRTSQLLARELVAPKLVAAL